MKDVTVLDGVDDGPLAQLVGTWKGDKGMDIAPEHGGPDENPYDELTLLDIYGGSFEHTDRNSLERA